MEGGISQPVTVSSIRHLYRMYTMNPLKLSPLEYTLNLASPLSTSLCCQTKLSPSPPPTQKHCGEYPHPTQKKIFHCREYPSQPKLKLPCGEFPPRTQKKTSTMVSMSISPTSKNYFWECVAPIEKTVILCGECPLSMHCPVSSVQPLKIPFVGGDCSVQLSPIHSVPIYRYRDCLFLPPLI